MTTEITISDISQHALLLEAREANRYNGSFDNILTVEEYKNYVQGEFGLRTNAEQMTAWDQFSARVEENTSALNYVGRFVGNGLLNSLPNILRNLPGLPFSPDIAGGYAPGAAVRMSARSGVIGGVLLLALSVGTHLIQTQNASIRPENRALDTAAIFGEHALSLGVSNFLGTATQALIPVPGVSIVVGAIAGSVTETASHWLVNKLINF